MDLGGRRRSFGRPDRSADQARRWVGGAHYGAAVATLRDVSLLRLAAQRLVGERPPTVAATVRTMTAMQGQDLPGVLCSAALRTDGGSLAGVRAAMDAGEVVRSWPMRGTLHLVAAEDLGWMITIGAPRVATSAARRQRELELDTATLAKAGKVAVGALEGGRALKRKDLFAVWQAAGISTEGQRGAHLLGHLAVSRVVCLGPTAGSEQALVLLDEWVPRPRRLAGDEAVAEWALRYFRSHGPATVADFAWWTGLKVSDSRAAHASVAEQLERLDVGGETYWLDPATPARLDTCRAEARAVHLLPGFDELLLGYRDRSAVLDKDLADRLVPGGNGMFKASVVAGGRVVGTWRRPARGSDDGPEVTAFTKFGRGIPAAITRRWAAYPRDR
jgi:Winged helix DNA-binding domain